MNIQNSCALFDVWLPLSRLWVTASAFSFLLVAQFISHFMRNIVYNVAKG